jgi:hypothetical protein
VALKCGWQPGCALARAMSVQCSNQAPILPKAAATYKRWSKESKVYARVVPRASGVCAQGAVLCKISALSASTRAQFLLFWLDELRPRRKTVQNIALQQETAHYAGPKESTQGYP